MAFKQDKIAHEVARALWQAGCVTIRPQPSFTWASGIRSPIYNDNRLLLSNLKAREMVTRAYLKTLQRLKLPYDVIAGVATSGIPLAAILADRLGKPLVYVRPQAKTHGRGRQVEGNLTRGERVILIEDLVSTGGSSLSAMRALRKAGAKLTHILATFAYLPNLVAQRFLKHRTTLIALCDAATLFQIGQKQGAIGARQARAAEAFLATLATTFKA